MSPLVLISVAVVLAVWPLVLLMPLTRKLAAQRAQLDNLAEKHRRTEGDLADLDRRIHRLGGDGALAALRDELAEIKNELTELKRKTGQNLRVFDRKLTELEERQASLADKLTRLPLLSEKQGSDGETEMVVDSPLVRDVLSLLGEGKTAAEIARAKGIQVGEVELIRGLGHFVREP